MKDDSNSVFKNHDEEITELNNLVDEYNYEVQKRKSAQRPNQKRNREPPSTKWIIIVLSILIPLMIIALFVPWVWFIFFGALFIAL